MPDVAIVTGGASGIGLAIGRALVRRGMLVVLADIDANRSAEAAEMLSREGPGSADAALLDVTDPAAVEALVESTSERHGRLDYMFNNAGVNVVGEPEELTLAHWERCFDVNVRGVLNGCRAAYPIMKSRGAGSIVNTASLAGIGPALGTTAPYNTTKYAVVGLSLSLRAAAAGSGVGVHAVCPGAIDTPIFTKTDLPGLDTPPSARIDTRSFFMKATGATRPYPADRLAEDVMLGVERNRTLIVAPWQARAVWRMFRLSPKLGDVLAARYTRKWRESAQSSGRARA